MPERPETERRSIARSICKSTMRNYYDLMRVHSLTNAQRMAQIDVIGLEYVYEALKHNKGIVAIAGHQGSFSFVCQIATDVNFEFYLTVEPIKPPKFFELIRWLREQDPRTHTIAVGGSETRNIFRALKNNGMVCIAIDRDVLDNGVPLTFFGAETKLPTGAAEIALRTGAPILPICAFRTPGGRHGLRFYPGFFAESTGNKAADVANLSAQMLRHIENMIRTYPEDWVVLQPIWPEC